MRKFEQEFLIRRPRLGIIRLWDWIIEFFSGHPRYVLDKVTVTFLYEGEVEPEVVLSGLLIGEAKSVRKEIGEF